jgi:hypothetical protein
MSSNSYSSTRESLFPPACQHYLLSLPVSPRKPHIPSDHITSLSLHPTIESALHILNLDLPSAHFLLRHMQAAPAWEAMYLHGILHRFEGDIDNARAWYGDVKASEVFNWVWGGIGAHDGDNPRGPEKDKAHVAYERAMSFLDRVEASKNPALSTSSSPAKPVAETDGMNGMTLTDMSIQEMQRVLSFCERKYGFGRISDASHVWVSMNEKHADKAAQMITGGEGWREF